MIVYAVEDKKDSFWPLIICGVNVGLIDEGLLGRYDIKTKQLIINLEGHLKRILRQNFDISIESAEDVKEIELKLRTEKNQTIAEWFDEYMHRRINDI